MNAGVQVAQSQRYTLGVASTDAQIAELKKERTQEGVAPAGYGFAVLRRLKAGRDINVNSTSVSTANAVTSGTNINQVASISGKDITLAAGSDVTANAAVVAGTGDVNLAAGRNVSLGAVNENFRQQSSWANVSSRTDNLMPAYKAVMEALDNGTLVKGVIGVDRNTGNVMMIRVK